MHSTSYHYIYVPARKIFRLGIYLRSFICWGMQFVILDYRSTWQESWSYQLDAIDAPFLYGSQPCHQYQLE